jgi:hypothetical protein
MLKGAFPYSVFITIASIFVLIGFFGIGGKRLLPKPTRKDKRTDNQKKSQKELDCRQLVFAVVIFVLALLGIAADLSIWFAGVVIGLIFGYFIWALTESALGGQNLPNRGPALIIVPLLIISLIFLFARMYLDTTHTNESLTMVQAAGSTNVVQVTNRVVMEGIAISDGSGTNNIPLETRFNAIYWSTSVFTTLGDGNFSILGFQARLTILFEQLCGFIALACIFGILVSRLSMFACDGESEFPPIPLSINETILSIGEIKYKITVVPAEPSSLQSMEPAKADVTKMENKV